MSQNNASGTVASRHAAGDHVAGVQRELGLEERRAGHAGDADQRIVRRDDDVAAVSPVAVGLDGQWLVAELLGC